MPVEESISVRFKGDVSDLEKSSIKAGAAIGGVGDAAEKSSAKTSSAFSNISSNIGKVTSQIGGNVTQIQSFSQAIASYLNNVGTPNISLAQVNKQIDELKSKINQSKAVLSITTDATAVENLTKQIESFQSKLSGLQQQKVVLGVSGLVTDFEQVNQAIGQVEANIQRVKGELKLAKLSIDTDPEKITALGVELKGLETKLNTLNGQKLDIQVSGGFNVLPEINREISELQNRISAAQLTLAIETDPESINKIKSEISGLENNLKGLKDISIAIETGGATRSISILSQSVETLRAKVLANKDFLITEKDLTKINAYNKEIDELEDQISKIQSIGKKGLDFRGIDSAPIDKFNKTLKNLPPISNKADQALLNLSRVAQDAPYGFIGIANNLNPLLESFQRLRIESGSNATALKALGSSLIGPGGIGLAIGVVSSLMVVFGDKLFGSKKAAEENRKEIVASITAYERFREELSKIVESLAAETAKISLLQGALGDSNLSLNDRKDIIHQLNEVYPSYLNKLGEEKTKYDALKSSIEGNIQALAQAAEIKAIFPAVEKLFQGSIEAQVELNRLRRLQTPGGFFAMDEADFKAEERLLTDTIDRNLKEISHAKAALANLAGGEKNLFEIIFGKIDAAPNVEKKIKDVKPKEIDIDFRGVRVNTLGIEELRKELQEGHEFDKLFQLQPRKIGFDFKDAKPIIKIPDEILKDQSGFIQMNGALIPPEVQAQFDDFIRRQQNLADTVSNVVTPAFQNMFSAILAGEAPLKSFFESLGQSVIQLIQKLIAAAIQAAILSAILPGGAGGVKGFSGFFKKILGFEHGGLAYGPTLGLVGEGRGTTRHNPEVVAPLNKLSQYLGGGMGSMEIFGRLRGSEIILSNAREGRRQRRVR